MREKKPQKKCIADCSACSDLTCPMYNPFPCYGIDCSKCEHPCELQESGINVIKEKQAETQRIHGQNWLIEFDERIDSSVPIDTKDNAQISFARKIQQETARKIAELYFSSPRTFDVTMHEIYLGENQSTFASKKGISRQAVSKAIKNEKAEKFRSEIETLKRQNSAFEKMSATEFRIYQLCGRPKKVLSIANVARQAGVSRQTVYATLHNLSVKYGFNFTLHNQRKRKS